MNWLRRLFQFEPHSASTDRIVWEDSAGEANENAGTNSKPPVPPNLRLSGRVVAIDCETTGLSPERGDRIVTFAAVELAPDGRLADNGLHLIFNPEKRSHPRAAQIHGYRTATLSNQDKFVDHANVIRNFLKDALIVGHNVTFDIRFLNSEFQMCGLPAIDNSTACTMQMWRAVKPGYKSSLDAIMELLGIADQLERTKHDALQDASISLAVYKYLKYGDGHITVVRCASAPDNLRQPEPTPNQIARTVTAAQALEAYQRLGTLSAAAKELGVSPPTIRNRLNSAGL